MKYELISASRQDWPVAAMCETLEVSRSGYYDYVRTQAAEDSTDDLELTTRIKVVSRIDLDSCGNGAVLRQSPDDESSSGRGLSSGASQSAAVNARGGGVGKTSKHAQAADYR